MFNDAEYEQLKDSILSLGTVLPGTIRTVFLRCGKKNCHCQSSDKKHWHGPYSFWDRKDGKGLSSRSIPPKQVKLLQGWINKRRELERIVRQMLKHGTAMAEGLKSSKELATPLNGGKSKKARIQSSKSKLVVLIILGLLMTNSAAHAADIQAQLDSSNGSSGLSIQSSTPSEVARIDSTGNLTTHGNVGVGTSTTVALLDVSTGGVPGPEYGNLAFGPGAGFDAYVANDLAVDGTAYFYNVQVDGMLTATGMHFAGQQSLDSLTVSGNTYLATTSGNVGIGTSTSASELSVNGGVAIGSTYLTTLAPTNGLMVQGNVGIGSLAPGQALDVQGETRTINLAVSGQTPVSGYVLTASDSAGDTTWSSAGGVSGWTVVGANVYETGSGNVGIGTTTLNQGALVVTNGNVGIGTWAPTAPLTIGANAFTVNSTGTIATSGGYTQSGNGTNLLTGATTFNAPGTSAAFINNVGIGSTAPGQQLDVQGTVRTTGFAMSGQTPISGYVLTASDSAGDTTWTSAGTVSGWTVSGNNVYETLSGNVGIGTMEINQGALVVTNGNVGIGTWAPTGLLAVGANALTVNSNGAITTSGGYTQSGNGSNLLTGITAFISNVGVGSTAPGQQLDIQGTVRTTGFAMSGQTPISGYVLTASDSAGDTTWTSAGTVSGWTVSGNDVYETLSGNVGIGTNTINQGALVVTNGNVGIGTWAPTAPLTIGANAFTVNSTGTIATSGGYTQSGTGVNAFTGNVGLGSTAPGQQLDVQGTVRTTGFAMSGQTPVSGYVLTASDSAGDTTWSSLALVGGWTVSGNDVYETLGGNVGIGTTTLNQGALVVTNGNVGIGTWAPTAPLTIGANAFTVNSTGTIATSGGYTQSGNGTNLLTGATTFNAPGTSAAFINNVGIGSTAPGQQLDVQGTVRTTGFAMSGQTPISGYVLTASDSAGDTTWTSAGTVSGWTVSGNNVYETLSGNVGIGTTALQTAFAVTNGNVGIGTWTAAGGNLIVNGGGNVGIGSAWPGQALDVTGIVRAIGGIVNGNVGIGTFALQTALAITNGNVGIGTWTAAGGNLIVNGGGNVGIGTIWPGTALDVNGAIRTTTTGGVTFGTDNKAIIEPSATTTPDLRFLTNNTEIMRITNGGNVGIGSMAPGQALDIQGTVRTTGFAMSGQTPISGYVLTSSDSAGDTTWSSPALVGGWTVSGNDVFETGSGNVGIGTFALQTALAITNGNVGIGTWTAAGGNLIVNGGGNVGIGTIWPGTALDVNGAIRTTTTGGVTFGTDNKAIIEPSATTTPDLRFLTNNTEIMRITNGGNVGIGSMAPGQALDIQGTVRTTGFAMSGQTPISGYVLTSSDSAGDTTWSSPALVGGWTVSGNDVFETGSGNVGIGTFALQTALAITNGNVGIGTWTAAGGNLIVNGGGNVGIGTIWPGQALDVAGTIRALGGIINGNVGIGTSALQTAFAVANGNVGIGTWTSSSTFTVIGSIAVHTTTVTAGVYSAASNDQVIIVNAGAPVTVVLPAVASVPGREYIIKRTDSTGNPVTIATASGSEFIDGQNTVSIIDQFQSYAIVCDGTQWNII